MTTTDKAQGFTADEKAAMKERAKELRAAKTAAEGEADVLAKIAEMPDDDRAIAERLHAIVKEQAPHLVARTWYGMPAYAKDSKIAVFFKAASKFSSRYATLGFEEAASLDEGAMWPTSYAITHLTPDDEARIADLVKRAGA